MDVSNREQTQVVGPSGPDLLNTVASLSGLPEPLVNQELDQILELTGEASSTVTLDSLREAMIAYLEMIGQSLEGEAIEEEAAEAAASGDLQAAVEETDSR